MDTRTDLYGIGVVLFEMVTGMGPFDLEEIRLPPASRFLKELPSGFDAALQGAVELKRESRYASASEFSAALAPFDETTS